MRGAGMRLRRQCGGEEIAPIALYETSLLRRASTRRATSSTRGDERVLDLVHGAERVPAMLLLPSGRVRAAPAALLLHGFSSSKERMAQSVGRALQQRGVASLALDLPFHGERDGARAQLSYRNPIALVGAWRTAVREARAAIEWLGDAARGRRRATRRGRLLARRVPRADDGVGGAGGARRSRSPRRAICPTARRMRRCVRRAVDPLRAARQLDGRPLLLVNGRRDTTTRPAQAERLFARAEEPKELYWYEGGHWPPASAIEYAAEWMTGSCAG